MRLKLPPRLPPALPKPPALSSGSISNNHRAPLRQCLRDIDGKGCCGSAPCRGMEPAADVPGPFAWCNPEAHSLWGEPEVSRERDLYLI